MSADGAAGAVPRGADGAATPERGTGPGAVDTTGSARPIRALLLLAAGACAACALVYELALIGIWFTEKRRKNEAPEAESTPAG